MKLGDSRALEYVVSKHSLNAAKSITHRKHFLYTDKDIVFLSNSKSECKETNSISRFIFTYVIEWEIEEKTNDILQNIISVSC